MQKFTVYVLEISDVKIKASTENSHRKSQVKISH